MKIIVTAGPTYEPLDDVRRLTNFSTGRLGTELANSLTAMGHEITLLIGRQATWGGERKAHVVQDFGTTTDLRERLQSLAGPAVDGVFHAAAVSDFSFGQIWHRSATGDLKEVKSAKIPTREGTLLAELTPTPKLIAELRSWFPRACLVGWKYELEGDRPGVIRLAQKQIADCHTNACVVNGKAYGHGFGLVTSTRDCLHLESSLRLFEALGTFIAGEKG